MDIISSNRFQCHRCCANIKHQLMSFVFCFIKWIFGLNGRIEKLEKKVFIKRISKSHRRQKVYCGENIFNTWRGTYHVRTLLHVLYKRGRGIYSTDTYVSQLCIEYDCMNYEQTNIFLESMQSQIKQLLVKCATDKLKCKRHYLFGSSIWSAKRHESVLNSVLMWLIS